jgi:hypothetical protein
MGFIFKTHDGKRRYYSAQYVLRDPTVEFAVLETAREVYYAWTWLSICDIGNNQYPKPPFRNKRHPLWKI